MVNQDTCLRPPQYFLATASIHCMHLIRYGRSTPMMLPISVVAPFIAAILAGCVAGGGGGVTAFSNTATSRRKHNLAPIQLSATAASFAFTAQNNNYHDIVLLRSSQRLVESSSTSCHSSRQFMRRQKWSSLSTALFIANTSEEDDDNNNNSDINNPLKSAGLSFQSASTKSLGMLFYNIGGLDHKEIQALLLSAGTHLVHAGEAWSTNWDTVRTSMYTASKSFYDISNVFGSANIDESLELGTLFERIGCELEDISNISGCTSVGPPCSSPNLLVVEECLVSISKILKKNSVASTDEHMMCSLFYEVAELFGEMAGRYVEDEEGQKSEVSL